uniref:Uncharacterized protein n=1 Tax=Chenopodium quinoa TaxID=63459 RepID=A0A803L5Z9_CHEQI
MDGNLRKSLSSNSMYSLNSRLDHLDSTIKYLEDRKCSSTRWTNDGAGHGVVNRNCVPIDLAVMEAQSKGSILDRITSLEERLIQKVVVNTVVVGCGGRRDGVDCTGVVIGGG